MAAAAAAAATATICSALIGRIQLDGDQVNRFKYYSDWF